VKREEKEEQGPYILRRVLKAQTFGQVVVLLSRHAFVCSLARARAMVRGKLCDGEGGCSKEGERWDSNTNWSISYMSAVEDAMIGIPSPVCHRLTSITHAHAIVKWEFEKKKKQTRLAASAPVRRTCQCLPTVPIAATLQEETPFLELESEIRNIKRLGNIKNCKPGGEQCVHRGESQTG